MTTNTSTIPPVQRTTPSAAKKRTRFSHLSRFAQMAAAVLAVGALLAGFLILFSQHSGTRTGASPTPPPGMYISRLGSVTHIDTRSHKVLWQTHLTDPSVPLIEPVAIGNAVYVLKNLTSLIALNAQTGTLLWTKTFPQQMLPLALDHGLLYLGAGSSGTSTDKILYVVDPETGSIITTYTPQGARFWSDMILVDGILYYGDQTLYAMQISSGKLLWRQHTGNTQSNIGGTVVQDGIIYTTVTQIGAKHNGWIDAFSARTGEKLWQSPAVILAGGLNELAVTSTMLYVSSRSDVGKLLAFNIQTHALVWQKTIDATHLLATSNILYVRSDVASDIQYPPEFSRLEALDGNSGKEVWQTPLNKTAGDEIVGISNGVFYWISWDTLVKDGYQGTINAFHAESGAQLWSLPTNATVGQWGGIVVI